jgi:gluconate 2-dehydrogenase gamma chain
MRNDDLLRRRFLQVAASGAAATVSCGGQKSRYRFLTYAEAATLAAVCDQIIPPDQDPGASQAGVVQFIDLQLSGFHRGLQKQYRAGLAALDSLASGRFGRPFAAAPLADQLALLTDIEAKKAGDAAARSFFQMVVSHTMQGFYGDPRHGGNRNRVSWRMLGVPAIPVRGRG